MITMPSASIKPRTVKHLAWHVSLMVLVVLSAFATVYVKDCYRRVFMQYQAYEDRYDQLMAQWGQLLLEQGTLARQERIAHLAEDHWQMHWPRIQDVKMLWVQPHTDGDQGDG